MVWGAIKFAGSFFETLGKESGEAVARWIRAAWDRSKEPGRDRMLSIEFSLDDGSVIYGFIPCSSKHEGDTHPELLDGLDEAGTLASFAGLQQERGALSGMKRAAFMFLDGTWHLAWWTDGESVFRMRWFDEHMPDPAGILGRPLLGMDTDVQAPNDGGD